MTRPLYTTELLRLAASLGDPHPLEHEDGRSDVRSPTCGSRVQLAVQLDGERRVERLSLKVHACAFGQASAALVEQHSRGATRDELADTLVTLNAWLSGESSQRPSWEGIEVLEPARSRTARHGAILLPLRALLAAIEDAR